MVVELFLLCEEEVPLRPSSFVPDPGTSIVSGDDVISEKMSREQVEPRSITGFLFKPKREFLSCDRETISSRNSLNLFVTHCAVINQDTYQPINCQSCSWSL